MPVRAQVPAWLLPSEWVRALAGPILDKELRVASRRRRNFALRLAYLVLLTAFVLLVWVEEVRYGGSAAWRVTRMAEAGRTITAVIVWFQFVTMQLLALLVLSAAISEEVHRRTLGVLMTTPVSGFQIVVGKLLSSLLQLGLLLAVSLPLLVVVRVFGGVPWDFVASGLCITLTAALFAGSLSLYFSIGSRRSYWVFLQAAVTMLVLFFVFPWACVMLGHWSEVEFTDSLVGWLNPWAAMLVATEQMSSARTRLAGYPWPFHCLAMTGASAALLAVCVAKVRRVALAQIAGETPADRRAASRAARLGPAAPAAPAGAIRRITGSPVVWREVRTSLTHSRRRALRVAAATLGLLLVTYVIGWRDLAHDNDTHIVYVLILTGLGLLATSVLAASGITAEKEAGTWPLLLCTTLSGGEILLGKAVGVFRRSAPVWLLLALHVVLFVMLGCIHPIVPFHLAMISAGAVVLLTGTGLFFGVCVRRTTVAVVMNLGLALALWAVLPLIAMLVGEVLSGSDDLWEWPLCMNPMAQAIVAAEHTVRSDNAAKALGGLDYYWPKPVDHIGVGPTTIAFLATMVVYMFAGWVFAVLAAVLVRRRAL